MILSLSTWPEIQAWLTKSKAVVIPIGSNEQHGPTGLLGTDWLCPEIIANEAHRCGGEILVAPTFNIGMAQHHLGFPGTISLKPSTFIAAISDWVDSLSRHGFQKIYFLNGHGGNIASIEAAFSETTRIIRSPRSRALSCSNCAAGGSLPASRDWRTTCFRSVTARTPRPRK